MTNIDKILEDVDENEWMKSETVKALAKEVRRLRADIDRLRLACSKANDEVCQTLGKALGYPRFKDDQKNFPGATEVDGVCVGDHVAESIADEAVQRIVDQRAKLVEAACELAMGRYEKPFKSSDAIIREVFEDYGVRLKFEDGKFTEDTKC